MNNNNNQWEFQAPKYWDFSQPIPPNRLKVNWFTVENISTPSFGAPKKRRPLRNTKVKLPTQPNRPTTSTSIIENGPNKSTKTTSSTTENEKQMSVFDRLSQNPTISFSRRTSKQLTTQQTQHHRHEDVILEEPQYELNQESSWETVGERIAHLDGSTSNEIASATATPNNEKAGAFSPYVNEMDENIESIRSIFPTHHFMLSPVRHLSPMSPQITMSPRIPLPRSSSTSIHKPQDTKITAEKFDAFFTDLLEQNKQRDEATRQRQVTTYFENLMQKGKKRDWPKELVDPEPVTMNYPNPPTPRKRTISTLGAKYAVDGFKKARFELKKSIARTEHLAESGSGLTYDKSQ